MVFFLTVLLAINLALYLIQILYLLPLSGYLIGLGFQVFHPDPLFVSG